MTKSPTDKPEDNLLRLLSPVPGQNHFRFTTIGRKLVVPPQWRIQRRIIEDFHLLFVCGGKGTYRVGDRDYPLKRGLVVFLTNGVPYSGIQDPNDPPQIRPIRFCRYDNHTGKMSPWLGKPFSVVCQTLRSSYFEELFEGLQRCQMTLGEEHRDLTTSYASTILFELDHEQRTLQTNHDSVENRIQQVATWMADHPLERDNLQALSTRAGLSPKYFSQEFKKRFQVSPKTYQVQQRLIYGRTLLENTHLNVAEVSEELGYPDPFVFSRQFKELFNRPPKDFRQSSQLRE
ncbi:helix-turn-helix domain-containing protein [Puniceicoccus vermicola]|uniref:Helix-turn-helix transcriptional regulator n=1 Tax=Puniceicoccus vermicola TaxID=388746 RepID=A0A7X1AZB1_9BACT|nr:AraC family transcriptional regulator [Puniceicoccus vermicola]MBC2602740.1 helix-turn-helix transcriptional regulator [Puniceicoccus vermicola]